MKLSVKIISMILAVLTPTAVLASCEETVDKPDSQITGDGSDATTAEPAAPENEAYSLYKTALEKCAALNSVKEKAEISLELRTKVEENSLTTTLTQTSTQTIVKNPIGVCDLLMQTSDKVQRPGASAPVVNELGVTVKDGIVYYSDREEKTKTDDISLYGLDELRDNDLFNDLPYVIPESAFESAEMTPQDSGASKIAVSVPGDTLREKILDEFSALHVYELLLGSDPEGSGGIDEGLKLSDISAELVFDGNGYFASVYYTVSAGFSLTADRLNEMTGGESSFESGMDIEITVRVLESFIMPGEEYTVELPEDADVTSIS